MTDSVPAPPSLQRHPSLTLPSERLILVAAWATLAMHVTLGLREAFSHERLYVAIGIVLCIALAVTTIVLVRRPGTTRRAGLLLLLVLSLDILIYSVAGGGLRSSAIRVGVAVPLLATFLVDARLGLQVAGVLTLGTIGLLIADPWMPVPQLEPHSFGRLVLTALGIIATLGLVAFLGLHFEQVREQALEDLAASERRFRLLSDHTADSVIIHDDEGRIVDANDRACTTLGYTRDELLKLDLGRIDIGPLRSSGRPHEKQYWRAMSHRSVISVESRHQDRDGNAFPVDVRVSRFDAGGKTLYVASARDVTGKHYAQEALKTAKEEAEKASLAKTQFLANMSHEMRTPLNSIIGFARVLHRGTFGPLSEQQDRFARNILEAGEHMLRLVNDLLDYRRMEEGHTSVELAPMALLPAVEDAVLFSRADLDERQHRLELALPLDLPPVLVDRQALVRILTNLISNACKYTEAGGHIIVKAREDADMVTVLVKDNGVGIAKEDLTRVFNYFEQAQSKLSGRSVGSGLGLALARQLVRKMGGEIHVESEVDKGSTFWFTLQKGVGTPSRLENIRAEIRIAAKRAEDRP